VQTPAAPPDPTLQGASDDTNASLRRRRLAIPFVAAVALAAIGVVPLLRDDANAVATVATAGILLAGWTVGLYIMSVRGRRSPAMRVTLLPQHYVQACAHTAIFLYWGLYWRPVYYEAIPRIAAQLLFAYAFDILLTWSRRQEYVLGFGPVPIVLSTNLFLWFRPGWLHLQLAMIGAGFAGKSFIRWERGGRRVHVFNPSSFALALFSLGLILTGTTDVTRGQQIAITQFFPPHMYLFLFLVSLPGQFLFGVATMTISAVLTTYLFGLAYFATTGTYFFYDSYIPLAVFLGMLLLVTDPSTSPRTEPGRLLFGVLYGLSAVALYQVLSAFGVPTFYDKLLQVPLLNLSVRAIDDLVASKWLAGTPVMGLRTVHWRRHLASVVTWGAIFAGMSLAHGVGDDHPGQWLPFWQQACRDGRRGACTYLANTEAIYCRAGSGWACNEWGLLDASVAPEAFARGCELGATAACENLQTLTSGGRPQSHGAPTLADLPIVLRGSKAPIRNLSRPALAARACAQNWPNACVPGGLGLHEGH